jgi:hypothetical protein
MRGAQMKSIDNTRKFAFFSSRPLVPSSFEAGKNQDIEKDIDKSAMFDVASVSDPKAVIRLVWDGGPLLSGIIPRPMTEVQAAAWLAGLYL